MGWVKDLKSIPGDIQTNAVLRERIQLYEDKYNQVIKENESLRAENSELLESVRTLTTEIEKIRKEQPLEEESDALTEGDINVLIHLYEVYGRSYPGSRTKRPNDFRELSNALSLEPPKLQYHLDRLNKMELATVVSMNVSGGVNWGLTEKGIAYVIENGLS